MRTIPLRLVTTLVLVCLPLTTVDTLAAPSPAPVQRVSQVVTQTQSVDDQAMFEALVASADAFPPLAPPGNETLTETADGVSAYVAGVTTGDFYVTADFMTPADAGFGVPWDIGFIFGDETVGGVRVFVDSRGAWYTSVGSGAPTASGPVLNLATRPGDTNTLTLFVAGSQGLLGVNGQVAGSFALPVAPGMGDVGVGVGFSEADTLTGRGTPFRNFLVRPFDMSSLAPEVSAPQTVQPAPGAVQAQTANAVDPEAAALLTDFLSLAAAEPPDIGPATGELVERADGTTGGMGGALIPDAANFLAVMTLVNPADTSTPWTAGFAFRYAPDGPQAEQILLAATGHIIVQHINAPPEIIGQATNIDTRPGARNTLELLAYGDMALIGVNGVPVVLESLAGTEMNSLAGVGLVSGIYPDDRVPGRAIGYENFRVWFIVPE